MATTEPVANYLLEAAGLDNMTPWSFQAAVMNGTDPSPQDVATQKALFTGHKWAADMLLKHMEQTIYCEGTRDVSMHTGEYRDLMARVRAGKESRRIIFLGGNSHRSKPQPVDVPTIPPHA